MPRTRRARGFTLVEVLVAMFVLLIGATGAMSIYTQGLRLHADARRMTRATAIAEDLLANIELWPYDTSAGPLTNDSTTNDGDLGDFGYAFEGSADPVSDGLADHDETDLPAAYTGLPAAALGTDYQRFWNVALPVNATTGGVDAMRISVVVRWRVNDRWHRLVLHSVKPNPATVH